MININYGKNVDKVIHCVRHGEVDNPNKVLYGRLKGFHLSVNGKESAKHLADFFSDRNIKRIMCSPLERTCETIEPYQKLHPDVVFEKDDRLIEAENHFQGKRVNMYTHFMYCIKNPKFLRLLVNPFKPSWGEEYQTVSKRMVSALTDMYNALDTGEEGIIVSHQLPIWILRRTLCDQPLAHNPYNRSCSLASITTFTFSSHGTLHGVWYMDDMNSVLNVKLNSIYKLAQ